jgi:pimeloyl-ACP methyl ester carboxylesterase
VVAPLLRGYEPCSQPIDDDYHIIRMVEDVLGWIEYLGALRVHLVGHDWGAVIGYQVAALAPERLLSLTTMAVPHLRHLGSALLRTPRQFLNSWYTLFFQARGVAELAVKARDFALIERLWRAWSPGYVCPEDEMRLLKRTLRQPGVVGAALAYYRAAFDPISRAAAETPAAGVRADLGADAGADRGGRRVHRHADVRPGDAGRGLSGGARGGAHPRGGALPASGAAGRGERADPRVAAPP